MRSRALVIGAIALAIVGALVARVSLAGRAALAEGDAAFARGEVPEATAAWESAARWYLPLAPHVDDAYERLTALAARAETDGDAPRALAAWRAVRSAALATRGAWSPHAVDRAAADAAIARLSARDPEGSPRAGSDVAAREAWFAAQLAKTPRPGAGATLLVVLGLALWLGGAIALARRGVDMARRSTLVSGCVAVAGLAAWAIGLYAV